MSPIGNLLLPFHQAFLLESENPLTPICLIAVPSDFKVFLTLTSFCSPGVTPGLASGVTPGLASGVTSGPFKIDAFAGKTFRSSGSKIDAIPLSNSSPQMEKIFNPWNPRNKIIDDASIIAILNKYGVLTPPPNPDLFRQACVHKSYVDRSETWAEEGEEQILAERPSNCLPLQEADNEECEFAGDSLLGCVVALYLYERYAGKGEGFLTRLRTRIVNNKMLGTLAKKMGFEPWIIVSRHVEEVCAGGRSNLRLLGSMFEAWIYALYKNYGSGQDGPGRGFVVVKTFIISIMQKHVNFVELITDDNNFKDQLLRYFQATFHQPPRYKEVEVVGPPHDRTFTMGVIDPNNESKVIAKATARNKKVAEQEASRLALVALGQIET